MLKMFMTGDNAFGGTKEVRCGRHGRGRARVGFNISACRHADGILFFFFFTQDLKRYLDKKVADDELRFENNMYALP